MFVPVLFGTGKPRWQKTSSMIATVRNKIIPRVVKVFDGLLNLPRWNRLHRLIADVASKNDNFFFIEIGCNDGVIHDPLYQLILTNNWRGILVEPVKFYFDKLRLNYQSNANLVFENIAISDKDETRDFYRVMEQADHLPAWSKGLGSFYPEIILKHKWAIPDLETYIVKDTVRCYSLASLLKKHNVDGLNLLMIDTEGYDYEILKQIDFSKIKPELIIYEHKHISRQDRRECMKLLSAQDYVFTKHFSNTLAYRRPSREGA